MLFAFCSLLHKHSTHVLVSLCVPAGLVTGLFFAEPLAAGQESHLLRLVSNGYSYRCVPRARVCMYQKHLHAVSMQPTGKFLWV